MKQIAVIERPIENNITVFFSTYSLYLLIKMESNLLCETLQQKEYQVECMQLFTRFKSPNIESYAGDPMILDIDNVCHPVRNLERAVLFYRDVLRLELQFIAKEMGWAEFDVGGSTLALREIKSGFVCSQSSICFLVTEIEEEVERLKKEGTHFLGEIEDIPGGQGRVVGFQDVDGNRLDFYEPPQ